MGKKEYFCYITKETAEGARDRALDALTEMLKEGEDVYTLFKRVDEYRELNKIVDEIKEKEEMAAAI